MTETHVNFFGGSPLNRLSWLRPSHAFLNTAISSPQTRWLLFNSGQPLVASTSTSSDKPNLAYLTTNDVKPFLGSEPYFGQGQHAGTSMSEEQSVATTEAARHLGSPVVFLGLHEPPNATTALPLSDFKDADAVISLEGTPYFSMDIADVPLSESEVEDMLSNAELAKAGGQTLKWAEPRPIMLGLDQFQGALLAGARSMVDWNFRNKFCPACGSRCYSLWGGWKLSCSSLLPWADNTNKKRCPSAKGLQNFAHPRTDSVVIMIAINAAGDKILLGRNRRFPGNFYSALAGFIEPGESFEDAVAREMWEEAGVKVWNVKYHSGQPWPFPANLMVGFYAQADDSLPVRLDLDNELVDAKWFTRSEVLAVLRHPTGATLSTKDYRKLADEGELKKHVEAEAELNQVGEPEFRVPPVTAIAGVLIRDWAEGKISFPPEATGTGVSLQKSTL